MQRTGLRPASDRHDVRQEVKRLGWVLLAASVALVLILWISRLVSDGVQRREFASCRNHVTHVQFGIFDHVAKHGAMPFHSDLPGEKVFCLLDFRDALWGLNCHAGAPGQKHGGWQMLNAPIETWDAILTAMPRKVIPVLWCGRSHYVHGSWKRIVVVINNWPCWTSFTQLTKDSGGYGLPFDVVYGMPEKELQDAIEDMNLQMKRAALPPIASDVTGEWSYAELAKPAQTKE